MHLDIRHLRVLLEVARAGSVSGAAQAMGVSQPSLSSQLARIERAFGYLLFERGPSGVRPTPAGEQVLQRAARIVHDLESLVEDARPPSPDTTLRIGANAAPFFADFLLGVEEALPDYEIVPVIDISSVVLTEYLLAGDVDAALMGVHRGFDDACPTELRELVVVDSEPMLVAMSASHRLAGADEVGLGDLGEEDWLLPPGKPDGTMAAVLDAFAQAGIAPSSRLGSRAVPDYWPYIAAGHAVSIVLPTALPADDATVKPLRGSPVVGRRVLRWDPRRLDVETAVICANTARAAYLSQLAATAVTQPWWDAQPQHRPIVAPARPRETRTSPP
ncbi:LysR family transcriptional regulator [Luteipulveratus flavus]|uniref:LysR family transcriptional regulator n=1 Tax=Luteipulveratus flavus TaxID=3031728 RepID=A0ABT6C5K8_9MICO|nr:LysR family transcriptional regulator [Luteipulveratus sp. YIM 133296]MDF8264006.1 LysR family transcriptional regulator [Luteipulveratus sp. YIM 133296]